jgi:hypothetical protein
MESRMDLMYMEFRSTKSHIQELLSLVKSGMDKSSLNRVRLEKEGVAPTGNEQRVFTDAGTLHIIRS